MINISEIGLNRPDALPYIKILYELLLKFKPGICFEIGSGFFTFSKVILAALEINPGHLYTCDVNPHTSFSHPLMTFYPVSSNDLIKTWSLPVDFFFIDGRHTNKQVFLDYYNYFPFVKSGGLIAFHDINIPHGPEVKELWNIVKLENEIVLELTKFPGLGIIRKTSNT